jgi:CheY-like chemotaxis protein
MARVLVVDDDPDILALVQLQLRHSGYATSGAQSGPEALGSIDAEGPPDVAILDVRMPGMSGYELLDELRARGFRDLPVIFLSARTRRDEVAGGGDAATPYITKPYALSDLLREIELALSGAPSS